MLFGDRADERLDEPEEQILERHREPEIGAADADIDAHLRQEQPERLAHAHRQRDDEGGAGDDDPRAFHGGECGGEHTAPMLRSPRQVTRAYLWPAYFPLRHPALDPRPRFSTH